MNLKLLPNEYCDKTHKMKVTDVMLCAGEMNGGKDTCKVKVSPYSEVKG